MGHPGLISGPVRRVFQQRSSIAGCYIYHIWRDAAAPDRSAGTPRGPPVHPPLRAAHTGMRTADLLGNDAHLPVMSAHLRTMIADMRVMAAHTGMMAADLSGNDDHLRVMIGNMRIRTGYMRRMIGNLPVMNANTRRRTENRRMTALIMGIVPVICPG